METPKEEKELTMRYKSLEAETGLAGVKMGKKEGWGMDGMRDGRHVPGGGQDGNRDSSGSVPAGGTVSPGLPALGGQVGKRESRCLDLGFVTWGWGSRCLGR